MTERDPDLPPPGRVLRYALWVLGALLVLGVVLVLGSLVGGGGDSSSSASVAAARPSHSASTETPSPSPSPSPESTPTGALSAEDMTAFLNDYLATVTTDPAKAWTELAPTFQAASGGYGSYVGFWGKVQSATPSKVFADPATQTIGYVVTYTFRDGRTGVDQTRLHLARAADGSVQIDGEG